MNIQCTITYDVYVGDTDGAQIASVTMTCLIKKYAQSNKVTCNTLLRVTEANEIPISSIYSSPR